MSTDTALFDIEAGKMTPPIFEAATPGNGPALTAYGRHHGLGPGIWDGFGAMCGQTLYGAVEAGGRRVWIYHACSAIGVHDRHKCDRCEETW